VCLVVLGWKTGGTRLAVAANRDEFFARRTAPAAFWPDAPQVFAGRDLVAGGTWMGVTRTGRFAALTNFRDLTAARKSGAPSRGKLVGDFLRKKENESASDYVMRIRPGAGSFEGFNLLLSDGNEMLSFSNVEDRVLSLPPGVYGLSNHFLETPWPKVTAARARLAAALAEAAGPGDLERRLLALLADRATAPDGALPDTGLPPEWERALSAAFVALPDYGTRASTSLVVTEKDVRFVERSFGPGGEPLGEARAAFPLSATPTSST